MKSRWFRRAVRALLDEAVREVDVDRAEMLALVAAHGCFSEGIETHRQEDLASYIHDLAQLGTDDTVMLKLICEAHRDAVKNAPNLNSPMTFNQGFRTLKEIADRKGLQPDDCLAVGLRLAGFGLAHNTEGSVMDHAELRFRPTRRGLYLVSLLAKVEESMAGRRQQKAAEHTQSTPSGA